MDKSRILQDDMCAALVYEIPHNTTQVPTHVDPTMVMPTTGVAALDFGTHTWCRPTEDNGLGYFLNVAHTVEDTPVHGFSSTGITASQYSYQSNDWHIEPFMAVNEHDLVTKKYLMHVIQNLENRIIALEERLNDRR